MLKISIITVSYNAAATIEQAISSVVNQTYKNIEYIIIDGGSTDGTVDIIRKYEDRIAYWVSEPDKGIYDAMNKGIDAATGDYVYFLGADDALLSKDIVWGITTDIVRTNADLYSYGVYIVDNRGKQKYYSNAHAKRNSNLVDMVPHQGMFVRYKLIKYFQFDTHYKVSADYKFFLQCYLDVSIRKIYFDRAVAFFAFEGLSSNNLKIIKLEHEQICKELGLIYTDEYSVGVRLYVKKFLYAVGLLRFIRNIRKQMGWKEHKCDNVVCRWCKRGMHDS